MKRLMSFSLAVLLFISSFLSLASPSLAAGGGSHKTLRMCAKVEYTYKNKSGKIYSGTTNPAQCGGNFTQQHSESSEREASRQKACDDAWKLLPKLAQGDTWVSRSCKPFQQA